LQNKFDYSEKKGKGIKMEKLKEKLEIAKVKMDRKLYEGLCKVGEIARDEKGFDGLSEKSVIIIGVIVVAIVFIGAMKTVFSVDIIPAISSKILDLFNV